MSNQSIQFIQGLLVEQASAAAAPASGQLQLWAKTDGTLHIQNSSAVDAVLAILGAQTFTGLQTFNSGISIPTGQSITGAGTAAITGFVSASLGAISGTTGAFSSAITSTATNGFIANNGASTSSKFIDIENTGGSLYMGVSSSTGTGIMAAGRAYAGVLAASQGIQFSANNGTTIHMDLQATGLSVTGALTSSTGFGCNGNAAQTKYASGGTLAGVVAALVANGILSN